MVDVSNSYFGISYIRVTHPYGFSRTIIVLTNELLYTLAKFCTFNF